MKTGTGRAGVSLDGQKLDARQSNSFADVSRLGLPADH